MTIKDRVISLLGFAPSDANSIDGAIADAGLTSGETYTQLVSAQVKRIAISIMELLLTTPDYTNGQGESLRYDRTAVEARIKLLKGELGLTDKSMPTINTKRVW